jgi:hypothetical protein
LLAGHLLSALRAVGLAAALHRMAALRLVQNDYGGTLSNTNGSQAAQQYAAPDAGRTAPPGIS